MIIEHGRTLRSWRQAGRPIGAMAAGLLIAALGCGAGQAAPEPGGYLGDLLLPRALDLTPAPPAPDSAQARADLDVFAKSRSLEGGPRWRLAQRDVTDEPLTTFACALGVALKPGEAPAVERLLDRLGDDRGPLVDAGKFHYRALRPYQRVRGDICEAKTAHLAGNPDFPSGHAAGGWSTALVLAELAPDRAPEILIRGRAFMESRVACGSHTLSAVNAAGVLASALVAAEHGSAAFRSDADAARRELQTVRLTAAKPDPAQCRAEAQAIAAWRP
jgi:acid phosphatase (class A)